MDEYGVRGSPVPDQFHYLNQSGCYRVDRIDDLNDFNDTVNAMDTMGISMEDQKEVFRLCFAILYLGNIEFTQNEKDEARVSNRDGTWQPTTGNRPPSFAAWPSY